MPEDFELVREVEALFKAAPETITLQDLDNLEMMLYARLRSIMTVDQLHNRAHMLIAQAEQVIRTPGAFTDDEGNAVEPVLVENFEGGPDEVNAMLKSMNEGLDDAEIEAFMASFRNEGEEE